jgi:membrane associated rhomboid family serine protease
VFYRGQKIQLTAVKVLIGLNILSFVFCSMLGRRWSDALFGLSGSGLSHGMVWQLISYQFVHGGFLHLALNMAGLWFSGRVLEDLMGAKRFVALYLTCGVAGGLLQMLFSPGPTLVGASGAVCGLVAAFSALFPYMPINVLLFFVIPVRMKAMWLGILIVGVSLFLLVTGIFGNIGNAAHIGGAVAGYLWVRFRTPRFRVLR